MKRAGIVLCGGRSQRMGRPKALLPWFGRSMIEHVVATLAPCVDEVVVVTSVDLVLPARLADLGARIVVDREPSRGPLAALRDGLAVARAELAFVTASDAPFLFPAHVEGLFEQAEAHGGAAAPCAEGRIQVLSAVYPSRARHDAAALLSEGGSSPTALLERIGFVSVACELRDGVGAWTGFNTPDEYLALARRRDPSAKAVVDWRVEWRPERQPERRRSTAKARSASRSDASERAVAIGRLGEILRAAAPPGVSLEERISTGGLRVSLAGVELSPVADAGLPIGPGERVVVKEIPLDGQVDSRRPESESR